MNDLAWFRTFAAARRFVFAKSMAAMPHWYTVRHWASDHGSFEKAVQMIRDNGYDRPFRGKPFKYLDIDGWSYWTMGAPVSATTVLNRARADDAYHTALSGGVLRRAAPVQRWSAGGSVAFQHDVTAGPLPGDYDDCDIMYADLPWPSGMTAFSQRAGATSSFAGIMAATARIIESVSIPVVLTGSRSAAATLPKPDSVYESSLNGKPCRVFGYRIDLVAAQKSAEDILDILASRYQHVGDPFCGYGRAGRVFREHGGEFVLSDYNAECIGYIAANADGWTPRGEG